MAFFTIWKFTVIPQNDGLMDFWISGLLGLSSRRIKNAGVQEKY
jgi:hypothetical protein